MTNAVSVSPTFYPATYIQYLKHPDMLIRMFLLLVVTGVAFFFDPKMISLPLGLTAIFFGWQYYNFRTVFPKRTVTRTFGDMVAELDAPTKEPVQYGYVNLKVEAGRGIAISGGNDITVTSTPVVSPNASVSLQDVTVTVHGGASTTPRLQQDDVARASVVRDEDVVSAESPIEGVDMHDLSENEIERVTNAQIAAVVTAPCELLTAADYAYFDTAYPMMDEPNAAADFIGMSYEGILENGVGGPKSGLGMEVVKPASASVYATTALVNDYRQRVAEAMAVPGHLLREHGWRVESTPGGDFKVVGNNTGHYIVCNFPNAAIGSAGCICKRIDAEVSGESERPKTDWNLMTADEVKASPLKKFADVYINGLWTENTDDYVAGQNLGQRFEVADDDHERDGEQVVSQPYWMSNLEGVSRWVGGPFSRQVEDEEEEEGKEIVLTPMQFHSAACTPAVCLCTSKDFLSAVEAAKDVEVPAPIRTPPIVTPQHTWDAHVYRIEDTIPREVVPMPSPVQMPSSLFSRAVERQLEAGKLRRTPDGTVRAVRDTGDVMPGGKCFPAAETKVVMDYVPTASKPLSDAGQKLMLEMLKAIPSDLLEPEAVPVAKPKTKRNVDVVRDLMQGGKWWTLKAISQATGFPEASVSARMRDLRKPEYGNHAIERKFVHKGLYMYRMTV